MRTKYVALMLLLFLVLSGCGSSDQAVLVQAEATGCDAAVTRCEVEVEKMTVSLTLQPGLVALKPFTISAAIDDGGEIEQVLLDFQMVGMDMGPNRYRLLQQDGEWQGTATLPVCTASRSDWLAVMEFQRGARHYRLKFPFTSR